MGNSRGDNPGSSRDRLRKDLKLLEGQWQGQAAAQRLARMMAQRKLSGALVPQDDVARRAIRGLAGLNTNRVNPTIPPGTLRTLMPERLGGLFAQTDRFRGAFGSGLSEAIRKITLPRRPGPLAGAQAVSNIIGNLPRLADFSGFWEGVGRAAEGLRRMMDEAQEGELALEEAEFGFADHLWNVIYLGSFAGLPVSNRDAVITNKLRAFTCSDEFVEPLLENVSSSKMLGRRSRIIERCLEAHQRREYELSIPSLMTQIEGAIGDAMFLKELVVREGNKYYLVGSDGKPKLNRKNERLPAITLSPAIRNANLDEHPELSDASEFLSSVLVQRRNDILHGRDVRYGKAKLSVQSLLVLSVLSNTFEELEET